MSSLSQAGASGGRGLQRRGGLRISPRGERGLQAGAQRRGIGIGCGVGIALLLCLQHFQRPLELVGSIRQR